MRTIGLLLKLGLPPFHVWLLECRFGVSYESLWSLLTLSKLLPLALIFSISSWMWGVLYIIVGRVRIFTIHTVVNLLVVRRWLIIGWITLCVGAFRVMVRLLIYVGMMSRAISLITQISDLAPNPISWVGLLMIVGLPLSRIFLIKFYLLSEISIFLNGLILIIMIIVSVFRIIGYYHVYSLQVQILKLSHSRIRWQSRTFVFVSWLIGLILMCLISYVG